MATTVDSRTKKDTTAPRQTASTVLAHAKQDRVSTAAGSLAYHWFLALFPTAIALLGLSALLHLSPTLVKTLVTGATKALPPGASSVVTSALQHAQGRVAGALVATVIAALIGIWSASSAMTVLQTGLDIAYEVPRGRTFLAKRGVALLLMLITLVLGGIASALVVFGAPLGTAIAGLVPLGASAFLIVWNIARWILTLGLIVLLFSMYYAVGPKRSHRGRFITPGAFLAAAIWLVASLLFSFYTTKFGSYGRTYGAFAGVAILIFWLYLTGLAVLFGAELNAALERHRN